jgi:16S rRNA (cytosine967-C5)-methyltransferase
MSTASNRSATFERLRGLDFSALAGIVGELVGALGPVLREGAPADRALDRLLRGNRGWSAPQRQAAAEALFGVSLWRRRLGHLAGGSDDPSRLLAHFLRDLVGVPEGEVLRLTGLRGGLAPAGALPEDLGVRWSVPAPILDLLTGALGEETEPFLEAINRPGPICLRANRFRIDREALRDRLAGEGVGTESARFAPDALVASHRFNVYGSPAHQAGLFEVQDEGSQLLGHLLEPRPGEAVLDFCAGAGGKTLVLAGLMQNEGRLVAHDVDADRLDRLQVRADRAGVRILSRAPGVPTETFDRVLVDAPCSELGTLRRGPDVRHRLDVGAFGALSALQAGILEQAAGCTRPGGTLVYATCTLRMEENEDVVRAFLEKHPEFRLRPPELPWLDPSFLDGGFFRALPHRHGTDGFFAATLRRLE